jgi:hypothetical protein
MFSAFLGSRGEVIQVSEDDASEIMENVSHGLLECHTCVLESKRHNTLRKSTPWGCECGFILIHWMDLDLVVAREAIHEGQGLMAGTIIDEMFDERGREVFFGTCMVDIAKVSAYVNNALFFVDRDRVGNP